MLIEQYISLSGIDVTQVPDQFYRQIDTYQQALANEKEASTDQLKWQYQVPELGEGGSCSLFDQLAAQPYDLEPILGGKTELTTALLARVTAIVDFYQKNSGSQWFGVYQKRINPQGETVLVKLAYYGAASRAEFPLTPEFAAMSNNSTVGLSGKARIINDVGVYLSAGGEYYTCDPKVQSEACLPLFAEDRRLVGIIDSEAFAKNVFVEKELSLLLSVAVKLGAILS
ncbi:GAF domain-containing protein [Undibacterium sp. MH2W]|uniref:GAF domain-containing protein n=1 Tax=Undibacterium sp. MH2W TaxID=3413044 RepID=UPI003BF0153F